MVALAALVWLALSSVKGAGLGALITRVPNGYTLDSRASGHLDAASAVNSTVADSGAMSTLLGRDHFDGGQSRIWINDGSFIGVFVYEFGSAPGAADLEGFEISQAELRPGGGVSSGDAVLFPVAGLAAARGFFASGMSRVTNQPIFIEGAWFTVGSRAYLVETGGSQPGGTGLVSSLAVQQHRLAQQH